MRFPKSAAETEGMIQRAVEAGVNYFDTAYIYPGSEEMLGRALAKHNLRDKVFIASKMPLILCRGTEDFDRFFDKELERLKTDHIDYYLMHMITDFFQWEKFCAWGIEKWIADKKAAGQIGQIGFSFHGSCDQFLRVLDAYGWEFCQIQYNYSDPNYQAGVTGLRRAAEKGMPVIIMEPLLGGKLVTGLSAEAKRLFADADTASIDGKAGPAEWGLRWLWDQPEVTCVLSGMNAMAQMEENLQSAERARPLSETERGVYDAVRLEFNRSYKVHCTGCNYCMPCPAGVNIPGCFAAYNTTYALGFAAGMQQFFTGTSPFGKHPAGPSLCKDCGKCETHCPQHLPIRQHLKEVKRKLEPWWLRAVTGAARGVLK
jgi:predicted aldo/keto reductase-like oxidoreductase